MWGCIRGNFIPYKGGLEMNISNIPTIMMFIYLVILGVGFYCLLLLIKLINKAIKALDVYIDNNDRTYNQDIKK